MNEVIERPPRTLLEVFRNLPEGTLAQLIENNLIMSPAPLDIHQKVAGKLFRSIGNFVDQHDLGETRFAPYDVFLDKKNVFQPDIIFISKERLSLIQPDGLYGAPDLVVEILSPSTAKYDLEEKKYVYERNGVKEYWIVEPSTGMVEGYKLVNESFMPFPKAKHIIESDLFKTTFRF